MRPIRSAWLAALAGLSVGLAGGLAHAETVVQIPLTGVLDARSVTTLSGGQLTVWTLPTDGGNLQNAFATAAVAKSKGKPPENALPDDGKFPANARHPEVILHFSNDADAAAPQTHLVPAMTKVSFPVPAATYSKLFLFFNGAANGTNITFTLMYADGMETQMAMVPDYYADVSPTDAVIFNLATNLAKWDKNTTVTEDGHHNITGVELHPMPAKMLSSVTFERTAMGNLVFWGATGVATSDVAGVGGAGGAGGAAGAGGVGGAAGAAGSQPTGGAGAGGTAASSAGVGGVSAGAGGTSSLAGGGNAGTATSTPQGGSGALPPSPATDSGCGCRMVAASNDDWRSVAAWLLLGAVGSSRVARRRRSRSS